MFIILTAPLFKKLNLLTIKYVLALQELKLYYKFIQNTNIHNHYTRNQNEFYIAGTKHAFAKQSLKHNLSNTLNATPQIVKDKLFIHSLYGFTNYVKYNFIQKLPNNLHSDELLYMLAQLIPFNN